MMRYQHNNSTFIPKESPISDFDTPIKDDSGPTKEKLLSQVKEYNNKIKEYDNRIREYDNRIREMEGQLRFKDTEIHSSIDLIASLEEEIYRLKEMQNSINTVTDTTIDIAETDNLNIELNSIKEENAKLKKEIAIQNEHAQLLYVLIIILAII